MDMFREMFSEFRCQEKLPAPSKVGRLGTTGLDRTAPDDWAGPQLGGWWMNRPASVPKAPGWRDMERTDWTAFSFCHHSDTCCVGVEPIKVVEDLQKLNCGWSSRAVDARGRSTATGHVQVHIAEATVPLSLYMIPPFMGPDATYQAKCRSKCSRSRVVTKAGGGGRCPVFSSNLEVCARAALQPQEFWAKYDGYGCMAFEVGETGFSVLHKAAAFGWPQQARFLLAKNPEMVESRTSAGRSAREIAESAVAWCLAKGRKEEEQQHREVAELCHSAERGETIAFKLGPT
ncbi:unnamed protein product [Durusdinium trenchii]|uniref:Uncharacterized protein n=1 Tax=Durusdinium trenchii TaxID=1381693 RepID=A0ABP0QB35_9DINO